MPRYNLPADTAAHVEREERGCQHPALRLEKYIPQMVLESARERTDQQARFTWMRQVADDWNRGADRALWRQVNGRWDALAQQLDGRPWDMRLDDRLIVGLGRNTVLDTGLTIHHTSGLPFLPGSALKGLARAWANLEAHDDPALFGAEPQDMPLTTGGVIFLDAFPLAESGCTLAVDIMNPHYAEYYGDGKQQAPATYLSPVPIFFLTARGGIWRFGVAPRPGVPGAEALANQARAWLGEALQHLGAGGKTSAGYGYFSPAGGGQEGGAGDHEAPAPGPPPASEPGTRETPPRPSTPPIRTTLTILRIDTGRNAYRVEPRGDALPRIAQQHKLPVDTLREARWLLPLDAFPQSYGKRATTPPCEVERIEQEQGYLLIWMKPAARKETGGP